MSYETLLKEFLSKNSNRIYASNILIKLTGQHQHGFIAETRKSGVLAFIDRMEDIIDDLVEDSTKKERYTASILPTAISPEMAPNFWFKNEKKPTREETYRLLYLLLTSVYTGSYLFNLDNVAPSIREDFREWLIEKKVLILREELGGAINLKEVLNHLSLPIFPLSEFGFSILMLSYFVSWLKYKVQHYSQMLQLLKEKGFSAFLSEVSIDESATLVIFNIHRQKKEMHLIPRVKDFIIKWYSDFINDNKPIELLLFLSSLYITHENYRELSERTLDKFIYYLMRGYVNGELLTEAINLKIKYEFKEGAKKPYPIRGVRNFMRKIG
ncbi:MAG: hypothetical protein QXE05_03790 [Nitrososphaeria archaeon]